MFNLTFEEGVAKICVIVRNVRGPDVSNNKASSPLLRCATRVPSTSSSLSFRPLPSPQPSLSPPPLLSLSLPLLPVSSLLLDFVSLVFDAAAKLEPPGRRRFEGLALLLPPLNELVNLPRRVFPREIACICSSSSGGGEPEEGVEGDGEPGSVGESIVVSCRLARCGGVCLHTDSCFHPLLNHEDSRSTDTTSLESQRTLSF